MMKKKYANKNAGVRRYISSVLDDTPDSYVCHGVSVNSSAHSSTLISSIFSLFLFSRTAASSQLCRPERMIAQREQDGAEERRDFNVPQSFWYSGMVCSPGIKLAQAVQSCPGCGCIVSISSSEVAILVIVEVVCRMPRAKGSTSLTSPRDVLDRRHGASFPCLPDTQL